MSISLKFNNYNILLFSKNIVLICIANKFKLISKIIFRWIADRKVESERGREWHGVRKLFVASIMTGNKNNTKVT